MSKVGKDCFLYYSTSYATPTRVLIAEAQDVSLTLGKTKVDIMSRASTWKAKAAGLKELTMTFGYQYKGGADTVFDALFAAYMDDTPLVFWALDDAAATTGAQGIVFPGLIFDFPIDQGLEAGVKFDIGVEFTRKVESSALVEPDWFEVTA